MDVNPVLSEIQSLSPAAKSAMGMAGYKLPDPPAPAVPPGPLMGGNPGGMPSIAAPASPHVTEMAPATDAPKIPVQGKPTIDAPSGGGMPTLATPAAPNNVSGPVPGTLQGDTLERERLMKDGAPVDSIYHRISNSGFGQNHPFLGKLLGGLTEGAAKIGEAGLDVGSMLFAPGLNRLISGTEARHDMLLGNANTALTTDYANAQKGAQTESETAEAEGHELENQNEPQEVNDAHALSGATTANLQSETDARDNPKEKWEAVPGFQGPNGEPLEREQVSGHYRIADIGGAKPIAKDKPPGTPQQQTYDSLIQGGMNPVQAYEKIRERVPGTSQAGTWELKEDGKGNAVEYNTKTGKTQEAPQGIANPGTHAKAEAATLPAKQAMDYATDYGSRTAHTGPGDEALMEKFFELAKPSTGFRMSQPQIDMLKNAQSWQSSLEAHLRHATSGTWFSDDQRKEIVNTMGDLARAKGLTSESAPTGSGSGMGVSLKDAMSLPQNKGKSADEVRKDITAHGHQVNE